MNTVTNLLYDALKHQPYYFPSVFSIDPSASRYVIYYIVGCFLHESSTSKTTMWMSAACRRWTT